MGRPSKWNKSYIGKKYGYLTILGLSSNKSKDRSIKVYCKCICGKVIEPIFYLLIGPRNQISCGCMNKNRLTHGLSYSKLYKIWHCMENRCKFKFKKIYKDYGGRGITVCPEWKDFLIFRFQMRKKYLIAKKKYKNESISIERIDNNKGYYYENCTFIPRKLQNKNRRSVYPVKAVNKNTGKGVYAETQIELAKKINLSTSMVSSVIQKKRRSKKWIIRPLLKTPNKRKEQ